MPLLVLSLLLAYWFKASFWKRTILVISSIPLAMAVNGLRIALTGILYSIWGASVAEDFFHGFSSWLIFIGMIPFLLLEIWVLKRLPPKGGRNDGRWTTADARTMEDRHAERDWEDGRHRERGTRKE
jgi:exosortase/archaeosortase family protein